MKTIRNWKQRAALITTFATFGLINANAAAPVFPDITTTVTSAGDLAATAAGIGVLVLLFVLGRKFARKLL